MTIDVEGNNNRIAGRDYHEHHEYYFPAGEGARSASSPPPTLEQLLTLRKELRHRNFWAQLHRIFNAPFLIIVGMGLSGLLIGFWGLGHVKVVAEHPWSMAIPFVLIILFSATTRKFRYQIDVIHAYARETDEYLQAVEMEIARRKVHGRMR